MYGMRRILRGGIRRLPGRSGCLLSPCSRPETATTGGGLMFHPNRRWCVGLVESAEALAEKLTGHTWTLCTAFSVRGSPQYLFLNDSISEDGAAEFGVVKAMLGGHVQIESITFGWTSKSTTLHYIHQI